MADQPKTKGQQWVRDAVKHEFGIIEAVQRGIRTRQAIADHLGLRYTYASQIIRNLVIAEVLEVTPEKELRLVEVKSLG